MAALARRGRDDASARAQRQRRRSRCSASPTARRRSWAPRPAGAPGETWAFRQLPLGTPPLLDAAGTLGFGPIANAAAPVPQLVFARVDRRDRRLVGRRRRPSTRTARAYRGPQPNVATARVTARGGGALVGRDSARPTGRQAVVLVRDAGDAQRAAGALPTRLPAWACAGRRDDRPRRGRRPCPDRRLRRGARRRHASHRALPAARRRGGRERDRALGRPCLEPRADRAADDARAGQIHRRGARRRRRRRRLPAGPHRGRPRRRDPAVRARRRRQRRALGAARSRRQSGPFRRRDHDGRCGSSRSRRSPATRSSR